MLKQKPENPVTKAAGRAVCKRLAARSLQQLSVLNARGTHLFTRAAPEAPVNVPFKRRGVVGESSFANSAHEIEPAAWTIVFIAGNDVGRTSFQAQPAVNAGEKFLLFSSKS